MAWDRSEEVFRASQDAVCETCGKTYREHPMATEPENLTIVGSWDGKARPYMHRICSGRLVKL